MISSLLLYVNQYNLKRISVFILFISVLISFSLAAYVLLILGMILYYLLKSKHYFRRVFRVSFFLCSAVVISVIFYVNNPDSVYSKLVVARLDYDEERGISEIIARTASLIIIMIKLFCKRMMLFSE